MQGGTAGYGWTSRQFRSLPHQPVLVARQCRWQYQFGLAHDVLPRGDIDVQAILEERPDLSPLVQVYELASEITEELAEIDP